jgi:hypothetical protein
VHPLGLGHDVKSTLDGFVSGFGKAASALGEQVDKLSGASQGFATLGRSLDGFASAAGTLSERMGAFNDSAAALAKALSTAAIPSRIEVVTRNDVVVTLNGAGIIAALKGDVAAEAVKQLQAQLGDQVRKIVESMNPR